MSDQLDLTTQEETAKVVDSEPRAGSGRLPLSEVRTVEVTNKDSHRATFKKSLPREYFESAVVTLVMALFGMTFIVQAVKVPTGSMKNTIWIQDHLLVNKFIFGPDRFNLPILPERQIRRGDIVVFKFPRTPETNFVKRVIGLPGETVEYDARTNTIYINGQQLPERRVFVEPQYNNDDASKLKELQSDTDVQGAQWTVYYYQNDRESVASSFNDENAKYGTRQPFKVPVKGDPVPDELRSDSQLQRIYDADNDGRYDSDQYFCMGDNRDNSLDSRFWGTVPRSSIVGRAMFVYWSIDRSNDGESSSNPVMDFFTKTRWSRTGTFIK
ncbi:MAG: signal peptidase I [Acidobacteria bacterium]|nr:MAG: signal peptidase I [Acidobacteriota bacterium]